MYWLTWMCTSALLLVSNFYCASLPLTDFPLLPRRMSARAVLHSARRCNLAALNCAEYKSYFSPFYFFLAPSLLFWLEVMGPLATNWRMVVSRLLSTLALCLGIVPPPRNCLRPLTLLYIMITTVTFLGRLPPKPAGGLPWLDRDAE